MAAFEDGGGAVVQGCRPPLDIGKERQRNAFSSEPPEGI